MYQSPAIGQYLCAEKSADRGKTDEATDGQTDRQTERQRDRRIDRQTKFLNFFKSILESVKNAWSAIKIFNKQLVIK